MNAPCSSRAFSRVKLRHALPAHLPKTAQSARQQRVTRHRAHALTAVDECLVHRVEEAKLQVWEVGELFEAELGAQRGRARARVARESDRMAVLQCIGTASAKSASEGQSVLCTLPLGDSKQPVSSESSLLVVTRECFVAGRLMELRQMAERHGLSEAIPCRAVDACGCVRVSQCPNCAIRSKKH
jgi:hypothetical protein